VKLTEKEYWDEYWRKKSVYEVKHTRKGLADNAILDVFDKCLPVDDRINVLEIGGSPGSYLMYFARTFKYRAHSLDYSEVGNEQTKRNFEAAGLEVEVYQKDLFAEDFADGLPQFDVVYSLGFMEHFCDLEDVVRRHVALLKSGGVLILGVPNLGGMYGLILKRTAPKVLSMHNLGTMDLSNWKRFETDLNLTPIFKGYISGFEPQVLRQELEVRNVLAHVIDFISKVLVVVLSNHFAFLRRFNSRYWSGYMMGVYRKP
jgi:2-polyprenyl-3-methyl-5-hydroxy-6-metoxy-1,4-benzoquinol methylase